MQILDRTGVGTLWSICKTKFALAGHTHNYAGSGSAGGSANSAISVVDYGQTSKKIQIGYSGSGITGEQIKYIAGYTTGSGDVNAKIKDVSKDALRSWLGLGTLAYSSATITDNKVTLNAVKSSDYTNWRSLVFSAANSATEGFTPSTTTDGVFIANTLSVLPSSGTIKANKFKGALEGNASTASNASTVNGHTVNANVPSNAKFTDTNTWRPVQDNLTSTSTSESLSANLGRVLKGLVDGKSNSSHTHNSLAAVGNELINATAYGSGLHFKPYYNSGGPTTYGNILEYTATNTGGGQLAMEWTGGQTKSDGTDNNVGRVYYRSKRDCINGWTKWMTLAYTNDIPTKLSLLTNDKGFVTGSVSGNTVTINGASTTWSNTWRGILDNLKSSSTSDSLSANQGRILKSLVDGKANSSHTHSWSLISGAPATATRWPSWGEVTGKPTIMGAGVEQIIDTKYRDLEISFLNLCNDTIGYRSGSLIIGKFNSYKHIEGSLYGTSYPVVNINYNICLIGLSSSSWPNEPDLPPFIISDNVEQVGADRYKSYTEDEEWYTKLYKIKNFNKTIYRNSGTYLFYKLTEDGMKLCDSNGNILK